MLLYSIGLLIHFKKENEVKDRKKKSAEQWER